MKELSPQEPELLLYQRERRLDDVPAYAAGLQLALPSGDQVYAALSPTELTLYVASPRDRQRPEYAVHYDREGRLTKLAEPNRYHRRSLSHRIRLTTKRPAEAGGGVERTVLSGAEADEVVRQAHQLANEFWEQMQDHPEAIHFGKPSLGEAVQALGSLLNRARRFDVAAAHADSERFRCVYGRVAVLPPDQYNALVLQVTEGCAYSGCAFCELYRGVRFRIKTRDEFQQHLQEVLDYHGETLRARRGIFLGEANALTLPQRSLVDRLEQIRARCELPPADRVPVASDWWLGNARRFDGISSFLDAFTGPARGVEEWRELRELGLRQVYLGLESGDDEVLKFLLKPAKAEGMRGTVRNLREAGLIVGVIVLLGAGGRRYAPRHVANTTRLLNDLALGKKDYIYFSPLVVCPGGSYERQAAAQGVEPLTGEETDRQEQELRAGLADRGPDGRPYRARYELATFVY